MKCLALIVLSAVLLVACGDKPQSLGTPKQDTAPYVGTGSGFTASGWKQGDKTSWEQHLKARMQNGQNDYSKVN
ncbi:MAG: hypothetical protein Q7K57_11585 [Burkholderiaceae bacterium]|nr:hypothetical protein [Burkholderiaceae bacterium]